MKKLIFLAIVLIIAASCSSVKISSDFDRTAGFSAYKTYSFTEEALNLAVDDLNKNRLFTCNRIRTGSQRFYQISQ